MKLPHLVIALISFVLTSPPAQAQDDWPTWPTGDRFTLGVNAFFIKTDSDLTIQLLDFEERSFDLEDAFGLDDSDTVATIEASWRFAKRHSLYYRYFNLDRKSPTLFEDEDDVLINPFLDVGVKTHDLTYNYSFLFDERRDFYGGIGLSFMSLNFAIDDAQELIPQSSLDSSVPVPSLLLGYNWAFSEKWAWLNQVNYVAVELALDDDEDVEGSYWAFNTRLEWRVVKHLSLTAAYEFADIDVEAGDGLIRLRYQDRFSGPRIGAILRF